MLLCIICTALLLVVCFACSFSHIIVATIAKCTYLHIRIRTNVGIRILHMLKKLLMGVWEIAITLWIIYILLFVFSRYNYVCYVAIQLLFDYFIFTC